MHQNHGIWRTWCDSVYGVKALHSVHLTNLSQQLKNGINSERFFALFHWSDKVFFLNICSGVGAMEIVAMDMKLRGMYIARQLSFHGVTFKIEEVPLSESFKKAYDDSVELVSLRSF